MEYSQLRHFYQEQLVKSGVELHKAKQAANNLTVEELQIISQVGSDLSAAFYELERNILALGEVAPGVRTLARP